jgi:hypothetical protein
MANYSCKEVFTQLIAFLKDPSKDIKLDKNKTYCTLTHSSFLDAFDVLVENKKIEYYEKPQNVRKGSIISQANKIYPQKCCNCEKYCNIKEFRESVEEFKFVVFKVLE